MKLLVTGAAGFLGSHLTDRLLKDGHVVYGIDNLYTGNLNNLSLAFKNSNFTFINHDVTQPIDLKVDGIFNLACPASPVHYQNNPVETIRTSFLGALHCLDLGKKNQAIVLQASTSEVYGDPTISPQPEEYWGNVNPIGIRSCYDEGKRAAESLFFDFYREYGTRIKVARIFNTYGPRMDINDGRVVSNFLSQALLNSPITIYGDGLQTRSFCYVTDLIDGLVKLFFSADLIKGPINLGNPKEFTMLDLAEIICKLTNSGSELIYKDLPLDDPQQRKPSISKAEELLGWKPNVDLKEGLLKMMSDFEIRMGSND
jgi:UDP-glucuronate decarboxylase